jgi:gliding motility-associated-like protein
VFEIVATVPSNCTCGGTLVNGILGGDNVKMPYALSIDTANTLVVRCQGAASVTVDVAAKDGIGPYTFRLYDNLTNTLLATQSGAVSASLSTTTISNTYKIIVKDDGCAAADAVAEYVVNLTDYNTIPSVITASAVKVCLGGSINLTANYAGATSYLWTLPNGTTVSNPIINITSATSADSGTYTVSMLMPGCPLPYTESIDVDVSNPVKPNVTDTLIYLCLNSHPSGYDLSSKASVTSSAYELLWYGPNNSSLPIVAPATPTVSTGAAGVFEYYVSQRDIHFACESEKVKIKVEVKNLPAPIDVSKIDYCLDPSSLGSVTMRITGAGDNRIYRFYTTPSGGSLAASGTSHNDTAYISQPVTGGLSYYVETEDEYGCISQSRTEVDVPKIDPLITAASEVCLGNSLTFTTDNSYSGKITWTRPDNSQLNADLLTLNSSHLTAAGEYEVKVSIDRWRGCTLRDSVKVKVNETAKPTVSPRSYDLCQRRSASPMSATALLQHSLRWYNPAGNLITESDGVTPAQSPTPDVSLAGSFLYGVSQVNSVTGCESDTVGVSVLVRELSAPIDLDSVKTCIGEIPDIEIKNTVAGSTYYLYRGEHDVLPIAVALGTGGTILFTHGIAVSDVIVWWYVSRMDPGKCESDRRDIKIVPFNRIIDLDASNRMICEGSSGKLIAETIPNATYKWTKHGTLLSNQQELTVNGSLSDTGTYILTILTPDCDSITQPFIVSLGKPDAPDAPTNLEYCQNATGVPPLTGTPSGGCTLIWYDVASGGIGSFTAPTPATTVPGTFHYYLAQRITGTDCESDDRTQITVTIHALPAPVSNIDPAAVCSGSVPTITIGTSVLDYQYRIYDSLTDGAPISSEESGTGGSIYLLTSRPVTANTRYYIETKDALGCIALSRTPVDVNVTSLYIQPDRLPPYRRNVPYSTQLSSNASPASYRIILGDLPFGFNMISSGEISGTAVTVSSLERKTFTVEVEDNSGCTAEKEYTLEFVTTVSEIFTPNGDGVNDVFMKGCRITVFDRLGRKIFAGEDGWDGTYKGSPVAGDTYFYVLHYVDETEQMIKTNGSVTVMR